MIPVINTAQLMGNYKANQSKKNKSNYKVGICSSIDLNLYQHDMHSCKRFGAIKTYTLQL